MVGQPNVPVQLLGNPATPAPATRARLKLLPVIVTEAPTGAKLGDTSEICGVTTNVAASLGTPLTVTITRVEPAGKVLGTATVTLLSLQLFTLAATPPKVIVLLS